MSGRASCRPAREAGCGLVPAAPSLAGEAGTSGASSGAKLRGSLAARSSPQASQDTPLLVEDSGLATSVGQAGLYSSQGDPLGVLLEWIFEMDWLCL